MIVETNTVTVKAKAGNRIQEAGSQTAQATVTKRWLHLHIFNGQQVLASCCQLALNLIVDTEVNQVVGQEFTN